MSSVRADHGDVEDDSVIAGRPGRPGDRFSGLRCVGTVCGKDVCFAELSPLSVSRPS